MKTSTSLAVLPCVASLGATAGETPKLGCAQAEKVLSTKAFVTWQDAYAYYKRFSGLCSDGALAEALGAQFTQLLSKHWSHLPELRELGSKDPPFVEWVLLSVFYDPEETEINASNTACRLVKRLQSCQPAERALCLRLSERVGPSREYIRACGA